MSLPAGTYYGLPVYHGITLGEPLYGLSLYRSVWLALADTGLDSFVVAVADHEPAAATLTLKELTNVTALCRHDLVTAVRVVYAYDYAQAQTTRAIMLEAAEPLREYGRIEAELRCEWLTTPRSAVKVGTAWLRRKSRPIWSISFTVGIEYAGLNPGDWIEITHPWLPVSGRCLCLEVELDYDRAEVRITTEICAGEVPAIALTRLASAYDPQTLPGVTVQFSAGQVNLTFKDDSGKPLSNAAVTLDNLTRRTTDSAGNVTFDGVAHGAHLVTISAPGYPNIEQQITV